ncbi:MAG: hypothetical protein WA231_01315 [Methylocella sp.]
MVTPKNRLADGEAPLLCRQHGIPQGPARAAARRSTRAITAACHRYNSIIWNANIVHGGLLALIK